MSDETQALTDALLHYGNETIDVRPDVDDVEPMTRFQALAFNIWRMALGHQQEIGNKIIEHKPDKWAMKLLVDKLWTKDAEDEAGRSLAERLGEFDADEINKITKHNG